MHIYEDETGFVIPTLYVDDVVFLGASKKLLNKRKVLTNRSEMFDMGTVLRPLGMNVTRDRGRGAITIHQKDYTEDMKRQYGTEGCKTRTGPDLALNQPEEMLLNEEEQWRYHAITAAVMYLAQVNWSGIPYAVKPAGEGHAQVSGSSHGGGRVRTHSHNIQAGGLQACCFLLCPLRE